MSTSALITIDVDWAPDFMIRSTASLLRDAAVRSTWFVTHQSAAIDELRSEPELFELGIHPNFLPGSTQGRTPREVLDHCMRIVPEAVTMRTHALVQSGPLLLLAVTTTPIRIDASLFLPGVAPVKPLVQYVASGDLIRVPYSWEDDDEMARPRPCWDYKAMMSEAGPAIFDFHPIYVHLNASSPDVYRALKSRKASLTELSEADVEGHVSQGLGTGSMFRDLLGVLRHQTSLRLSDFVKRSTVGS